MVRPFFGDCGMRRRAVGELSSAVPVAARLANDRS
jgi:hypothetical protein